MRLGYYIPIGGNRNNRVIAVWTRNPYGSFNLVLMVKNGADEVPFRHGNIACLSWACNHDRKLARRLAGFLFQIGYLKGITCDRKKVLSTYEVIRASKHSEPEALTAEEWEVFRCIPMD